MTSGQFRALIDGSLALWQADGQAVFDEAGHRCEVRCDGEVLAVVSHQAGNAASAWRVECPGRTPRVHRSVVPALATLREALCPDRARGRALFVGPPAEEDPA